MLSNSEYFLLLIKLHFLSIVAYALKKLCQKKKKVTFPSYELPSFVFVHLVMQKLQHIILVTLLVFMCSVSHQAFSQTKCKYDYERVNESGDSTKATSIMISGGQSYETWLATWIKTGDQYELELVATIPQDLTAEVHKGDSMLITLENGHKVVFRTDMNAKAERNMISNTSKPMAVTTYHTHFPVTKNQLKELSGALIVHLHYKIGDMEFEKTVKERRAIKFQNGMLCIMK